SSLRRELNPGSGKSSFVIFAKSNDSPSRALVAISISSMSFCVSVYIQSDLRLRARPRQADGPAISGGTPLKSSNILHTPRKISRSKECHVFSRLHNRSARLCKRSIHTSAQSSDRPLLRVAQE